MLLHFHNPTFAYNHPYNLHQKLFPLLQSTFTSLFHPYFLTKSSLKSTLTLPSSIPWHFFTLLFLRTTISQSTPKRFSLSQPFSQFRLRQRTAELWSLVRIFNLFLFLDSDNNAYTHCLLIAQTHKMIILHSVVSDDDVCNWNSKPSNPPSLTPSTYCYYFHTLLIPSQELTFLNLFKLIFILILAFSYSIYAPLHR